MKGIGYLIGSIPSYGLAIANYIKYLKGLDNLGAVIFWLFFAVVLTIIAWKKHEKRKFRKIIY